MGNYLSNGKVKTHFKSILQMVRQSHKYTHTHEVATYSLSFHDHPIYVIKM